MESIDRGNLEAVLLEDLKVLQDWRDIASFRLIHQESPMAVSKALMQSDD